MRNRSRSGRYVRRGRAARHTSVRQSKKRMRPTTQFPALPSVCQKCAWGRNVRHHGYRWTTIAFLHRVARSGTALPNPGYRRPDRCWKCDPGARGSNCKGLQPLVQDCGQLSMYARATRPRRSTPQMQWPCPAAASWYGERECLSRERDPPYHETHQLSREISRPLL